jgi:2'-5' RNA ligase
MRLFTGIAIPQDVQRTLAQLIDHLRPHAHIKWSPPYNLHITTKFIGEWPEARLDELIAVLGGMPKFPPFDILIRGIGWFPNPHSPRVLWAAMNAPPTLQAIAAATDEATATLGIEREKKPFSPHLTLARIKEPIPLLNLRRAIADLTSVDFGTFPVNHFHLYMSKPGPASSIYTQLAEFPLLPK